MAFSCFLPQNGKRRVADTAIVAKGVLGREWVLGRGMASDVLLGSVNDCGL